MRLAMATAAVVTGATIISGITAQKDTQEHVVYAVGVNTLVNQCPYVPYSVNTDIQRDGSKCKFEQINGNKAGSAVSLTVAFSLIIAAFAAVFLC